MLYPGNPYDERDLEYQPLGKTIPLGFCEQKKHGECRHKLKRIDGPGSACTMPCRIRQALTCIGSPFRSDEEEARGLSAGFRVVLNWKLHCNSLDFPVFHACKSLRLSPDRDKIFPTSASRGPVDHPRPACRIDHVWRKYHGHSYQMEQGRHALPPV